MFLINVLINVLIKQDRVKLQRSVFCPLIPLALQWFLRDWWFLGKCVTPALQHCSSATRPGQYSTLLGWWAVLCIVLTYGSFSLSPSLSAQSEQRDASTLVVSLWDSHW
jgi:hypothetical protein